jgi:HPr kinase/phosphorylase
LTTVRVRDLLDDAGERLGLTLLGGASGCDRAVAVPRIQQPGLALAGFLPQLHADRVQVLGNSEMAYLDSLDATRAEAALRAVCAAPVACIVVTNGARTPPALARVADESGVPVLVTALRTGIFIPLVTVWLEERLAPVESLHANLVEVCGLGVLILGRSGIGKSEVSLDLITRGHRHVADDVVHVRRLAPSLLRGRPSPVLAQRMEIRGLGVIDVAALFGTLATREAQEIDLAVELGEWTDEGDRLGLDHGTFTIHGVVLPLIRIPVRPGRNLALLVETAVRERVLRTRGSNAAADLALAVDRRAARREGET